METRPKSTPFRSRRTLMAALVSLLAMGHTRESDEFKSTAARRYKHGKHNGRVAGAFGGPTRAKAHRRLYLATTAKPADPR